MKTHQVNKQQIIIILCHFTKRQTKNETFAYVGQPFKTFKAVGHCLNCVVFTSFGAVVSNRVTLVHKITYNKMGY